MGSAPQFAATPRVGLAQVSVANTNRDGTGTLADVLVGGANGTKINEIVVQAVGATTQGTVRIYLEVGGANPRLFDEFIIPVIASPGAGVAAYRASRKYDNLELPDNTWKLRASTHIAETFNVEALADDY